MKTIHRFVLKNTINDVELPVGAEVISVGISRNPDTHNEEISIWASVDTDSQKETRKFLMVGTGANLDDTTNFNTKPLGTVIKSNMYAFHVFEVKDTFM